MRFPEGELGINEAALVERARLRDEAAGPDGLALVDGSPLRALGDSADVDFFMEFSREAEKALMDR
jgi:hypothetical protein